MKKGERYYTATALSGILDLSIARIGQLAKEGVITKQENGKYLESAITQYVKWTRQNNEEKAGNYSKLLDQEKYREKKRENDIAEKKVAPVEVLETVLSRGVSMMVPILESLPLEIKRHWPEVTGDQILQIKRAIAKCRNAMARIEITLDD